MGMHRYIRYFQILMLTINGSFLDKNLHIRIKGSIFFKDYNLPIWMLEVSHNVGPSGFTSLVLE